MASLTPLSKGLIGLAVVGAMASAVWHLVLKDRVGGGAISDWQSTTPPVETTPNSAKTAEAHTSKAITTTNGGLSAVENFELGRQLMASSDFPQARIHLEAAVKAGDGAAACLLGEMTLKGQGGIIANQEESAKLFQLAQSRGSICFASGQ